MERIAKNMKSKRQKNLLFVLQAVIKQFGGSGYESSDVMVIDEAEMQRHQQLEKFYRSTRSGRVTCYTLFLNHDLLVFTLNWCFSVIK